MVSRVTIVTQSRLVEIRPTISSWTLIVKKSGLSLANGISHMAGNIMQSTGGRFDVWIRSIDKPTLHEEYSDYRMSVNASQAYQRTVLGQNFSDTSALDLHQVCISFSVAQNVLIYQYSD